MRALWFFVLSVSTVLANCGGQDGHRDFDGFVGCGTAICPRGKICFQEKLAAAEPGCVVGCRVSADCLDGEICFGYELHRQQNPMLPAYGDCQTPR